MIRSRERLACVTLLISFGFCVGIAIGIPLATRHFIRQSVVNQPAVLEQQRGTLRVQRGGQGEIIALVGRADNITRDTIVATGPSDQGSLTLYTPGQDPVVTADVQIYANTSLTLVGAHSPRFSNSPLSHTAELKVTDGRVRVNVTPAHERPTTVEIRTPHMTAVLSAGSYEVRVHADFSELAVRDGAAQATTLTGETVLLGPSQRTIAQIGTTLLQALPAERNLISNGQFNSPLAQGWQVYHRDIQQEPAGTVEVTTLDGRSAARLFRSGIGHVEVGIRQPIDYDVRDFALLTLHLNVRVQYQSLGGCGSVGSECPIMVRIDYKDAFGTDRFWVHGFYAVDATDNDLLPEWDEQVPLQIWSTYDSGNLVDLFEAPPAVINTVIVYASGHSFDALVTDVELLAQE